jgi:cell division control protein 6
MFKNTPPPSGLLYSESSLTTNYTPTQPVDREAEQRRIANALRPLTHQNQPENLLLYGPPGTGKTTVANHVLEQLSDETRVTTVFINCWQYNTRSALLTEVLVQLGYPAPRKGKPIDELLEKLQEWVTKHPGAVVVLDEFDQLDDAASVAYDLQQASGAADSFLGLILISNRSPSHLDLDPRSQSRLAYQPVEFRPYSELELVAILEVRVDEAFQSGTVSGEVIEELASLVAAENGDCREALTLLLRAGRRAAQEDAESVTVDHVWAVIDSADRPKR